jgi:drug/metabolite transporter (DMT)-like permease
MSIIDLIHKPAFRVLAAGAAAGAASAVVNGLYFALYQSAVGREYPQTGLGSIVVSSLLPSLLGAAAAFGLSRYTPKAGGIFAVVALGITALSLLAAWSPSLADGTLKPPGFDTLVLPMHVVVGAAAAWAVPRALRSRACPAPRRRGTSAPWAS